MKEIFGDKVENNRVFINWFTGLINFPDKTEKNKILRWDGVFYKIFEYETVLGFQNGNLISNFYLAIYDLLPLHRFRVFQKLNTNKHGFKKISQRPGCQGHCR